MNFAIKNRFDRSTIVTLQADNLRSAIEEAIKSQANLYGADLQEADLQWADLQGADLQGANLQGADLTRIAGRPKKR